LGHFKLTNFEIYLTLVTLTGKRLEFAFELGVLPTLHQATLIIIGV
jgi:hypothetical protein|tara:strand:- start:282 stop:419 length:138 start_codon:yes stop_codon:yes gene_type:complete